ncbi:MAG: hypothetical protein R2707_17345 [Acidimicrobiales bacterium]
MRLPSALPVALLLLASACSDDASTATGGELSGGLVMEIEMAITQEVGQTWTVVYDGWWDRSLSAGALAENGEVMWHERDGEVTRRGVMLPDLQQSWTRFDVATWGTVTYDDPQFDELGGVVDIWAVPSLASLVAVHDLVAAQDPDEGAAPVVVDGTTFLATIDEFVARRSLVDCAGDIEIGVEVSDGAVTALDLDLDTGIRLREVSVSFSPWEGALPPLPPQSDVNVIRRHREPGEPAPDRLPTACDQDAREPVTLDRSACAALESQNRGFWFTVIGRHAGTTPAARARVSLSLARPFGLDELGARLAEHDLTVTRIDVQAPTSDAGVMSVHGLEVTAIPADQAQLEQLVAASTDRAVIAGAAQVAAVEVDGPWADIAGFASSCDIHDAGPGNGDPSTVDLTTG